MVGFEIKEEEVLSKVYMSTSMRLPLPRRLGRPGILRRW